MVNTSGADRLGGTAVRGSLCFTPGAGTKLSRTSIGPHHGYSLYPFAPSQSDSCRQRRIRTMRFMMATVCGFHNIAYRQRHDTRSLREVSRMRITYRFVCGCRFGRTHGKRKSPWSSPKRPGCGGTESAFLRDRTIATRTTRESQTV